MPWLDKTKSHLWLKFLAFIADLPGMTRLKMKMLILLVCCCYLAVACAVEQPAGEIKFVTTGQIRGVAHHRVSLMQEAHADELRIGYLFADNKGCSGRYTDSKVKKDLTRVLDAWLEPLRGWDKLVSDKGAIVSKYVFYKGTVENYDPDPSLLLNQLKNAFLTQQPSLKVLFPCKPGRSYYVWTVSAMHTDSLIVQFDMGEGLNYALATLTHEMGHAFGLHDTYVGAGGASENYDTSTCGSDAIVGCQPLSAMNVHYKVMLSHEARLAADDIAGIRYVYRDIHAGERSCPDEYVGEATTGGCVPKNPLLFAIKNGDLLNAEKLIKEDETVSDQDIANLINKPDGEGYTLLHYAALQSASHGGKVYDWLLKNGADSSIKDNAGNTPVDLLLPQIEMALDANDPRIAESLISQALKE